MKTRHIYSLCFALLVAFSACKKTIDYEKLSANRMLTYKVTNIANGAIYGAIDHSKNTITFYLPFYLGLEVLQPEITVEEGATLSTAVLPVAIDDTTQTYTVKAADGSTRVYTLSIVPQNTPALQIRWDNETPETNPAQYATDIVGNFLSEETATLGVELVNRATKATLAPHLQNASLTAGYSSEDPESYSLGGILIPETADSGYYDVTVRYLGHTVKMEQPLHVVYATPEIAPSWYPIETSRRDTITFLATAFAQGNTGGLFIDLKWVKVSVAGTAYNLPIAANSDRRKAHLIIPDNFPVGKHGVVTFTFKFGNWDPITHTAELIIK